MSRAREPREQHHGRGRRRAELEEPIWVRPEPTGRRAPRSRDDIAEAAVAVADAEGLEAVSMRRVASELGLGTMSLYHYVRSKDELLDLMSDGIMGGQLVDDAELRKGWRTGLAAIAHATRRNFERHPWMGDAMRPRPSSFPGPNALRHVEQSLAAVADTGLDAQGQMDLIATVDDYVIGYVIRTLRFAEEEEHAPGEEWLAEMFAHMRARIEGGNFPHLQRALEANRADGRSDEDLARMASDERRFERGLERILDGIEVELKRTAKRRRGR
ncbi:MAG TPA: TetR/AcrR family transcriptional regulator [Solirubrobacteraceae bacterium]|nr:TetR/AcrR family transcriptional regulator [Solirubrobacteraceae bacterium]